MRGRDGGIGEAEVHDTRTTECVASALAARFAWSEGADQMSNDDLLETAATIWAAAHGLSYKECERAIEQEVLVGTDRPGAMVLRQAATQVRLGKRDPLGADALSEWFALAGTLAYATERGVPARYASIQHVRLFKHLQSREQSLRALGLDEATFTAAMKELRARVTDGVPDEHALRRRVERWRRPPGPSLVGAPVLDADEIERAIVKILADTAGQGQFSSTPRGSMFTHELKGYSREADRTYLDGLSDILDTSAGVIERHRGGRGGRVYITDRHVECADCRRVMAWINSEGSRQTARGRCENLERRRS